jgi:hypothetical protein
MRLVGNDVRSAAPGVGAINGCPAGTIPFDAGGGVLSCLPPVFRSSSPLFYDVTGTPPYAMSCGSATSPGYQLELGASGIGPIEPCPACNPSSPGSCTGACKNSALAFCPDDLVIVAVDDSSPLFLATAPGSTSVGNVTPLAFYGSNPGPANTSGYGLDDSAPVPGELFLLQGSGQGAALLQSPWGSSVTQIPLGVGGCLSPPCYESYGVVLATPSVDLFGGAQSGAVAMPARITQYAIEPVNAQGQNQPPFVSANLVRNVVLPAVPAAVVANGTFAFQNVPGPPVVLTSTVLVEGVIDMQVEFGIESPPGSGQLVYLSSGGLQTASWTPGFGKTPPIANADYTSCPPVAGAGGAGVYPGVCFPNGFAAGGNAQQSAIANLRSVRLNLLVRGGRIGNSRSASAKGSAAGVSAPFMIQAGVQDIVGGNLEGLAWGWTPPDPTTGQPTFAIPTADGAQYRQVGSEIFVRNLSLPANY